MSREHGNQNTIKTHQTGGEANTHDVIHVMSSASLLRRNHGVRGHSTHAKKKKKKIPNVYVRSQTLAKG